MGLPKPKRESRIRLKDSGPVPKWWVQGAVQKFRRDLASRGVVVPDNTLSLSVEDALRLSEEVDKTPAFDIHLSVDEIRRAFWNSLVDADAKAREQERNENGKTRQGAAMMALSDVVAAAEGFRQAVAEGQLSCDDLPYVARKKISEIFRSAELEGFGDPDMEAELKAQLITQQAEITRLRASVPEKETGLASLEAEVAGMIAEGRAPELYSERADRKEKPPEFLKRVYGKYLEKGREAIFLFQLRKLDPKFGKSLDTYCWKEGIPAESLIPTKRLMADRTLVAVGDADEVRRAVNAVSRRRQMAAKKATDG